MRRTLLILTLNERSGVEHFRSFLQDPPADEALAVDGGSNDGTVELLKDLGLQVVSQQRRGRGEAFRVGVGASRGDLLVFFSPDGNEDPADVEKLFARLEAGDDMVIASRFLPESVNEEDQSRLPARKWANQFFTWYRRRFMGGCAGALAGWSS